MNPIVRHFLPSAMRGISRRAHMSDTGRGWEFLPRSLVAGFETAFADAPRPGDEPQNLEGRPGAQSRASRFFGAHPYFHDLSAERKWLEVKFVQTILVHLLTDQGLSRIQPQRQVGGYYVDFAIEGQSKLAIEVDGFGKFAHREELDDFTERQNFITNEGWRVIRFSWGQIVHQPTKVLAFLQSLFSADLVLRGLLGRPPNLFDRDGDCEPVDPVGDFYGIQDWLVATAVGTPNRIVINDAFGTPLPFVALSISSLYSHLEAIETLLSVTFDVPFVEVAGHGVSNVQARLLHPKVAVHEGVNPEWPTLSARDVRFLPTSLPAPPTYARDIAFHKGHSVDEIQQNLGYFCNEVFGYTTTRPFQNAVIQQVLDQEDVLGIAATGGGKSFCFWAPAILKPGLTIVICPLRSLMRDQQLSLANLGIASVDFINVDVQKSDRRRIMNEAKLGFIRLLYVSPERLRMKSFLDDVRELQKSVPINFLVVDEAHCISEWGHDFRPSYLKIADLRDWFGAMPPSPTIIALTATAGPLVERDMLKVLRLKGQNVVRDPTADRERFSYQVVQVPRASAKDDAYRQVLTADIGTALARPSIAQVLAGKNQRGEKAVGITFCIYADPHGRYSAADGIAHYLFSTKDLIEPGHRYYPRLPRKYRLDAFGSGTVRAFSSQAPTLCPECHSYRYAGANGAAGRRKQKVCEECGHTFAATAAVKPADWNESTRANQSDFRNGELDVLVATKGFGMGIDKSSVRFVIHTSLSSGIESWYQEAGRAGRDNERAHIVLLVDPPTDSCRKELEGNVLKKPPCSFLAGCPHGRQPQKSLCDYGKQHQFVAMSYPGPEADAVASLRLLQDLKALRASQQPTILKTYEDTMSRDEVALHRLKQLSLIVDYYVEYVFGRPRFLVELAPVVDAKPDELARTMAERIDRILGTAPMGRRRIMIEEYGRLADLQTEAATRLRANPAFEAHRTLFEEAYAHLLMLLDDTYEKILSMRYNMLWDLHSFIVQRECRRIFLLSHFERRRVDSDYRCECCDICSPELSFRESRVTPLSGATDAEMDRRLDAVLEGGEIDLDLWSGLVNAFRQYPTSTYTRARAVLEKSPDAIGALFFAREFSPPAEYEANAEGLLRAANRGDQASIGVIERLFTTSKGQKSELLLVLDEILTHCDTPKGWTFLREQAAGSEHHGNSRVAAMRERLEFMALVKDLPDFAPLAARTRAAKEKLHA